MPYSIWKWTAEQIKEKHDRAKAKYIRTHRAKYLAAQSKYSRDHRDKRLDYRFRKMCGLTLEQYQEEYKRVKGICCICQQKKILAVDHDHNTKQFRGLICKRCNTGIGFLGDKIHQVERAVAYLKGEYR